MLASAPIIVNAIIKIQKRKLYFDDGSILGICLLSKVQKGKKQLVLPVICKMQKHADSFFQPKIFCVLLPDRFTKRNKTAKNKNIFR